MTAYVASRVFTGDQMPTFRCRSFLAFCSLVVGLVLNSCSKPEPQIFDTAKLKSLNDWQAVPLSSMLNNPVDAVCILIAYEVSVHEDVPYNDRMNAHLRATKYASDERDWAFVFARGDAVTVQKFHGRGRGLDLETGHPSLPRTFKAVRCTTIDRARIMKIPGPAVILGEDR